MSETVAPSKAAEPITKSNPFEATSKSILDNSVGASKKLAQSFDRSMHQPFRLDNKGMNREFTMKD